MRTTIIIPAYNEEGPIGLVLDEIPVSEDIQCIVVDNGSTDDTARVAAEHGATVVSQPERGYGAACLRGIAETTDRTDVIVVLDADHSDYPADLPLLLAPIERSESDFVIGSRVLGKADKGAIPWNERWGNCIACLQVRCLYDVGLTDMGPFRAIRRRQLLDLAMQDRTFGWNVEMQAKALTAGLRIKEVPVRYRKRVGRSKISGTVKGTVLAGTKIIGTIFKLYPAYSRRRKDKR